MEQDDTLIRSQVGQHCVTLVVTGYGSKPSRLVDYEIVPQEFLKKVNKKQKQNIFPQSVCFPLPGKLKTAANWLLLLSLQQLSCQ